MSDYQKNKNTSVDDYKRHVKERLNRLVPVFAKSSVGDFSENVNFPKEEDEFTEFYSGIQIMLDVIREKIADLTKLNFELERNLKELGIERNSLEELKNKYLTILQNVGEGLVATDNEGKILIMNQTAENILNWKSAEVVGKSLIEIIPLEDDSGSKISPAKRPLSLALSAGKKFEGSNYFYRKKDGVKFPVGITVAPNILGGKIVGAIEVFRDITTEKEIESAKINFLSVAAHQLRTPLGSMRWYLEMALSEYKMDGELKGIIEQVLDGNRRMVKLINDFLNVNRIDQRRVRDNPVPTDIIASIKTVVERQSVEAERKSLKVEMVFSQTSLPQVNLDPDRLIDVLTNLVSNSIKYNKNKGLVKIGARLIEDSIEIKVEDNGIGIPKKEQEKIFSRFFRAGNAVRSDTEGSGLGLFVVKSYIESWGGKIWFTSQENKGTVFTILIPLNPKQHVLSQSLDSDSFGMRTSAI